MLAWRLMKPFLPLTFQWCIAPGRQVISMVSYWCADGVVTMSSRCLISSSRLLVFGHRRNQWRVVSGWLLVGNPPAFIGVLWLSEAARRRDVGGRVCAMEGLSLSHKQTRAPFQKWGGWSQWRWNLSGIQALGEGQIWTFDQQQLIHLGSITELEQNTILSLIIVHLICVFGFQVRGTRSPSQMMYWRKSSDRKLYSCYLFVHRAFIICLFP